MTDQKVAEHYQQDILEMAFEDKSPIPIRNKRVLRENRQRQLIRFLQTMNKIART